MTIASIHWQTEGGCDDDSIDLGPPLEARRGGSHQPGGGRGARRDTRDRRQLELELQQQLELELIEQLELEFEQQLELQLLEQLGEEVQEEARQEAVQAVIGVRSFRRARAHGEARSEDRSRLLIEFLCDPDDKGVIAEPVPARTMKPSWFKNLPGLDHEALSATNNGLTVKRCVPFLDALSLGWIIPLAAAVRLEVSDGGRNVQAGWEFDREMVSPHNPHQAAGNPWEPRPMMKFHNPWTIRTPPGWSCLFVALLNRPNPAIEVLSGVVDTDAYVAPVNFPFVAVGDDGVHALPKGTPLVQVIPFERADGRLEGVVRAELDDEATERERVHRSTLAGQGWYRDHARAPRG